MYLFKHFKREGKCDCLPDSNGPLNKQVPSSLLEETNKEVDSCYKETSKEKKLEMKLVFSLWFCDARAASQGGEIWGGEWH